MTTSTGAAMRRLTARDGHEFDCWMHPAAGERKGGMVILQEIFGVADQLKGVAAKYAAQGLDVAIPALFDREERDAVVPFDQGQRGRDISLAANLDETVADIDAAVQAVAAVGGKVAVIGFCWGGGLALRAAQVFDIAGAVSFYGTRLPQYLDKPLNAPMLFHCASTDSHAPPEVIEQVRAALPEAEILMYEAGHAFANDARPADYVSDAADLAHERTAQFLDKVLS